MNKQLHVTNRHYFLDWLESSGNYVNLYIGTSIYPLRTTLTALSEQLEDKGFCRVHRSHGANNRVQLAGLECAYQAWQAEELMLNGATLADPARIDVRGNVKTGEDVLIDINVIFEGNVTLGNNVQIGPNCVLKNCTIGDNVVIKANTLIEDASVAAKCTLGPYARLRPGAVMEEDSHIGNFVEMKKTRLGKGSKANHLSYLGDAEIGEKVNIGAGTITCNYDGVNKAKTIIGDNAFIGSNSSLVAPVNIGATATVGAGSVITSTVEDEQLAIARSKQRNLTGWKRPVKK